MHLQNSITVRSTCSSRWLICVRSQRNWIASPKTKTYTAQRSSVPLPAARKRSRAAVLSVALSALFCRSTTDLARAALGSSGWPFHIHVQRPEVAAAAARLAQTCPILPRILPVNNQCCSHQYWSCLSREKHTSYLPKRVQRRVSVFLYTSEIPNITCDRSWRI